MVGRGDSSSPLDCAGELAEKPRGAALSQHRSGRFTFARSFASDRFFIPNDGAKNKSPITVEDRHVFIQKKPLSVH